MNDLADTLKDDFSNTTVDGFELNILNRRNIRKVVKEMLYTRNKYVAKETFVSTH